MLSMSAAPGARQSDSHPTHPPCTPPARYDAWITKAWDTPSLFPLIIMSINNIYPTHPVSPMYVPSPYPYLVVCRHLLVFPHTHTSGMGNGLLTSFFSFFVQVVRLASPSSLLPAEPFSKGLVLYVCFAHPSGMP
jgi:hypothetical protein